MSEPVIIRPTIGRRVWFWPNHDDITSKPTFTYDDPSQPLDAGIAYVHSDKLINVSVADQDGSIHAVMGVPLIQAGEAPPDCGFYCEWMSYQQGQAKKQAVTTQVVDGVNGYQAKAYALESIARAAAAVAPLHTKNSDEFVDRLLAAGIEAIGGPEGPAPTIETKTYGDGVTTTGIAPLPTASPLSASAIEAEIQATGLTAPRVALADIEGAIAKSYFFTAWNGVFGAEAGKLVRETQLGKVGVDVRHCDVTSLALLTFCVLITHNGFTVVGKSDCASPENFDAELDKKRAHADAVNQLWPLLGYELKSKLTGARVRGELAKRNAAAQG